MYNVYRYMCIHMYMYVYMCVCIYIYIYMYASKRAWPELPPCDEAPRGRGRSTLKPQIRPEVHSMCIAYDIAV